MTRQTWTAVVSGSLFVLLAALIALIPVPFVTWSPGESFNALGNRPDGTAVIDVQGLPTYRPESELLITTVKVTREMVPSPLTSPVTSTSPERVSPSLGLVIFAFR